MDFTVLVEDAISWVVLLAAMGSLYYALKLLRMMRKGRMQKSWAIITFGAFFGLLAMLIEVDTDLALFDAIANFLSELELIFMGTSSVLLLFGFRDQLRSWRPKNFNEPLELAEDEEKKFIQHFETPT